MTELISRPAPAAPAQLQLTERERELLEKLRRIDFWRAGRTRKVIVEWNGVRVLAFDGQQIG